jgi:hypothetical protein
MHTSSQQAAQLRHEAELRSRDEGLARAEGEAEVRGLVDVASTTTECVMANHLVFAASEGW